MTQRLIALTVILEGEPREDDVETIITAIRQLRDVVDVQEAEMITETPITEHWAMSELRKKLLDPLKD